MAVTIAVASMLELQSYRWKETVYYHQSTTTQAIIDHLQHRFLCISQRLFPTPL